MRFSVEAQDSKVGPEEITRDIPRLSDEALRDLGPDGVIRIGAQVKPGSILVGKITAKRVVQLAHEERLLRAIFGQLSLDIEDASLTVPPGTYGTVTAVKKQFKDSGEEHKKKMEELHEQLIEELANLLLGDKIPFGVSNGQTGEIVIPANRRIKMRMLRKLTRVYDHAMIGSSPIHVKINAIMDGYKKKLSELQTRYNPTIEHAQSGEGTEGGILKSVTVTVRIGNTQV
jgi:DNA-directed RNA polymerase subunit beta